MPDHLRDDEALPDAQAIICVVNDIDTPFFEKSIRQRAAKGHNSGSFKEIRTKADVAKFNAPFINLGIVSYHKVGR